MDININDKLWEYLCSGLGKYSKVEALCYLIRQVHNATNSKFCTSVNQLAKKWQWDNHIVDLYLDKMEQSGVLLIDRNPKAIIISLREEFMSMVKEYPSLFSLLTTDEKKWPKSEVLLYILNHQRDTYRSVAREVGWSHHSVIKFVALLKESGEIDTTPSLT